LMVFNRSIVYVVPGCSFCDIRRIKPHSLSTDLVAYYLIRGLRPRLYEGQVARPF